MEALKVTVFIFKTACWTFTLHPAVVLVSEVRDGLRHCDGI